MWNIRDMRVDGRILGREGTSCATGRCREGWSQGESTKTKCVWKSTEKPVTVYANFNLKSK